MKFHYDRRKGKAKRFADGSLHYALAFGVKVGYWPCFKGPYIEIAFGATRHAFWFGLDATCAVAGTYVE